MAHFRLSRGVLVFIIITLYFVLASNDSIHSAAQTGEPIRIYPATPSFSQPFFVTVSGQWTNSCVPIFHSMEVTERYVRLEARTPGPLVSCIDALTDWGFSVLVPPRPPDHHLAEVFIVSGITGEKISFARHEFDVKGGIQIVPALPLVNENVTLRLAELNPDGCVPKYASHAVQRQAVTVEAQIPDLVCGQAETPWQMEVALGSLAVSAYQAELFVTDYRHTPPKRTRLLEQSFVVVEQLLHIYLPLWGCFGSSISPLGCVIIQTPDLLGVSP